MMIRSYQLARLKIPLKSPFRTALRTVKEMDDVVVIVETDSGLQGFGSAPATEAITGDTHESIIKAIDEAIMPVIKGEDIRNLGQVTGLIQESVAGNSSAKAAVETAVYDLHAQSQGVPLYEMLGGGHPLLQTGITISVDDVESMVSESSRAMRDGFGLLKLKVGKDSEQDIKRVTAIREAVGEGVRLGLDANQGWSPEESVNVLQKLESAGVQIAFVEQPVKGNDLAGMQYVTERASTPVVADESAFGPAEVRELIRMRAADIINIKLMKCGGISIAMEIADIATRYDMRCMMGCMLETGIGVAAAAHVAVAKSGTIDIIDLDAPMLATMNPIKGGAEFRGAEIAISGSPGLGIEGIDGLSMLRPDMAAAS